MMKSAVVLSALIVLAIGWVSRVEAQQSAVTATYRITADVLMQDYEGTVGLQAMRYPPPFKQKFKMDLKSKDAKKVWQQIALEVTPKENLSSISVALFAAHEDE